MRPLQQLVAGYVTRGETALLFQYLSLPTSAGAVTGIHGNDAGTMIAAERVREIVREFDLDLTGISVLTECATGPYAWLGPIAAYAGATQVVCMGRSNRHGTFDEAVLQTATAAHALEVEPLLTFCDRERYFPDLTAPLLVTNSLGLRPLDSAFLKCLPRESVVAAMFEAWELRADDVDMKCADRLGIPIVTVNESHPLLGGIKHVGLLCIKMIFEAGCELADSRIALVGDDPFSQSVHSALQPWVRALHRIKNGTDLRNLKGKLGDFDSLVVADHRGTMYCDESWAEIASEVLKREIVVINVSGFPGSLTPSVNQVFPPRRVEAQRMSFTLDYLGALPTLRLMVGGLTAGRAGFEDYLSGRAEVRDSVPLVEKIL